jgi:two-component system, OmpR family, phosphate regulon sensor histidine kinase PhoR
VRAWLSARLVLTVLMTAMTTLLVALIAAVVRQSLADTFETAIPDTISAIWTVGVLLIAATTLAAWALAGLLLQPINDLRRNLRLAARIRAISEPALGDLAEIHALRNTLAAVLEELDMRTRLSESEQYRVLGLFESVTEGIIQVTPDARFLHVNAAARALLGLPVHAEGSSVASLVRNVDLRTVIERAARGEDIPPTEVVLDTRQLLVSPQRMRSGRSERVSVVIGVVDLTELRRLETVRRDFVANVSHELKTPLTSIRGYAETLLADDVPADTRKQFLDVIYRNASRLQRTVDELLDLSRLQSGGWRPDLQEVDVGEIASDVWSQCETRAAEKKISFAIDGGGARVVADPDGLRHVLSNLFDNAIRYTREGGSVRMTVHPSANGHQKDYIEIAVEDNGVGIPSEALPRIFERFFRVDPARSRQMGGTGLGLSIVKHLVDRMSGEVTAESELGKGTTITVRLPAAMKNV